MEFYHEFLEKEINRKNKTIERFKKAERAYNACYDLVDELNMLAGEPEVHFNACSPGAFMIWFRPKFTTTAEIGEIIDEWIEWKGAELIEDEFKKEPGYHRFSVRIDEVYVDIDIHIDNQCKRVLTGQKTVDVYEYVCTGEDK